MRGISFVIMVGATNPAGLSGHTRQALARQPARTPWHGFRIHPVRRLPGYGGGQRGCGPVARGGRSGWAFLGSMAREKPGGAVAVGGWLRW
jgi:hypothetical protein